MSEAVTPGPNFDWKREAEHYRYQCDQLRELLREVEEIGDQLDAASSAERDALRAELDALRAERDELKKDCHALGNLDLVDAAIMERDYFKSERDRYRAALERIANHFEHSSSCALSEFVNNGPTCTCGVWNDPMVIVARAALAGGKETG